MADPEKLLLCFSSQLACFYLRNYLKQIERVTIDTEYIGRGADIKGSLLYHIQRHGVAFYKDQIAFRQVGKKSAAHKHALAVYRGKQKPDHQVTTDELFDLLAVD